MLQVPRAVCERFEWLWSSNASLFIHQSSQITKDNLPTCRCRGKGLNTSSANPAIAVAAYADDRLHRPAKLKCRQIMATGKSGPHILGYVQFRLPRVDCVTNSAQNTRVFLSSKHPCRGFTSAVRAFGTTAASKWYRNIKIHIRRLDMSCAHVAITLART